MPSKELQLQTPKNLELKVVGIEFSIPPDSIKKKGKRVVARIRTKGKDKVIKKLEPGVDVVEPGKEHTIELTETTFVIDLHPQAPSGEEE